MPDNNELNDAKDTFINQWGAMGNAWGINRTMSQVHALLMVNPEPMTTNEIMEELRISRGNANSNLRELVGWGLVRSLFRKGDRKEYFEAEKDVWKMFCIISRERKRREIEPVLGTLKSCQESTKKFKSKEAVQFSKMMGDLLEFISFADTLMEKVASSEQSKVVPLVLKAIK